MNVEKAKLFAHELTLEYVKQHTDIMANNVSHINEIVEKIAKVNQEFYNAISKNDTLSKLY